MGRSRSYLSMVALHSQGKNQGKCTRMKLIKDLYSGPHHSLNHLCTTVSSSLPQPAAAAFSPEVEDKHQWKTLQRKLSNEISVYPNLGKSRTGRQLRRDCSSKLRPAERDELKDTAVALKTAQLGNQSKVPTSTKGNV